MGPSLSGKTLLFLRLVYPEVDVGDLLTITKPTQTLHVEPFSRAGASALLWDTAGEPAIKRSVFKALWHLHLFGVIYVVSLLDASPAQLQLHRTELYSMLLCHPLGNRLRFLVVLNTFDAFKGAGGEEQLRTFEAKVVRGLHLNEYIKLMGSERLFYVTANIKNGLCDPNLEAAVSFMMANLMS